MIICSWVTRLCCVLLVASLMQGCSSSEKTTAQDDVLAGIASEAANNRDEIVADIGPRAGDNDDDVGNDNSSQLAPDGKGGKDEIIPGNQGSTEPLNDIQIPSVNFSAGLLFGPEGIEPGRPDACEAAPSSRCYWVDAAAPDGGDGSFASPYNSFEAVVGYRTTNNAYVTGVLRGGDHLYLKGEFDMNEHVENGGKTIRLFIGDPAQGGTATNPTVIKTYKGEPRSVFNGRHRQVASMDTEPAGLIHIRTSFSRQIENIVFQNIEIKNAVGLGMSFTDGVASAEVVSVVISDTSLRDGDSSRGGVHFKFDRGRPQFVVRNSFFTRNYLAEGGNAGLFRGTSNNIGGVNILLASDMQPGAKITVRDNIFLDEFYAIRHKKYGNVETEIFGNMIANAKVGYFIRGQANNFHHNILQDVDLGVYLEAENQHGDMQANIMNNTFVDGQRLIDSGFENTSGRARLANVFNNIFSSQRERFPIALSKDPSDDDYDISQFTGHHNLFNIAGSTIFKNKGTEYNFAEGMALLNDASSRQGVPGFVNESDDINTADYRLRPDSVAKNAGSDGRDLGALQNN